MAILETQQGIYYSDAGRMVQEAEKQRQTPDIFGIFLNTILCSS